MQQRLARQPRQKKRRAGEINAVVSFNPPAPEDLFGRSGLLNALVHDLQLKREVILVRGPSGIGKSALLRTMAAELRSGNPAIVCLMHEVQSPAHSLDSLLASCTSQLLAQTQLPGVSWSDIGGALTRGARDHTWAFATAALLDLAGNFAPQTKKLTESIIKGITDELAPAASQFYAEQIVASGRKDMLAGFFHLLDAVASSGPPGCLIIDRAEAASDAVSTAVLALATRMPATWSSIVALNDETPAGLAALDKVWPEMAYAGGRQITMPPLSLGALEAWVESKRRVSVPAVTIRRVLDNCAGRPLFLRDWVERTSTLAEHQPVLSALEPYYQQRLRALSDRARQLLRHLALLPAQSAFPLDFCGALLSEPDRVKSFEIVQELVTAQFLQLQFGFDDVYGFVHEVARTQILQNLPHAIIKDLSLRVLNTLHLAKLGRSVETEGYSRLVLAKGAGVLSAFTSEIISAAETLARAGSYEAAREVYMMCLQSTEMEHLHNAAYVGLARVLFDTGHYQNALDELHLLRPEQATPELLASADLVRTGVLVRLNRYPEARVASEDAARLFSRLSNEEGRLEAERRMNTILRDLGEYEQAVVQGTKIVSDAVAASVSDDSMSSCLRGLARSLALHSDLAQALVAAEDALAAAERANSLRGIGNSHLAFGEAYRHGRQLPLAVEHYLKSLEYAERTANRDGTIWSALALADAYFMADDIERGQRALSEVASLVAPVPERHPLEYLHWQLSDAAIQYSQLVVDATEAALVAAAAGYDELGISWPHRYVASLLAGERPPKRF
jgi:tetratricopeptide (TPR) repeat protein